jgi:rhamnosyltransferase subunit B
MGIILLAYEFGSGLGHLNRLVAVAKSLGRERRFVFVLPNPNLGRTTVARAFGHRAEIIGGVRWQGPTRPDARQIPTDTLADVFVLFGYQRLNALAGAADRWRQIVDSVRPSLIISDFAPSLRLVAQDTIPMLVVGNGYTVPPAARLLPPLRPWQTSIPARSRVHEARLLQAANLVRMRGSGVSVDYFADLFSGDRTFVCTFPEFDPYDAYRTNPPVPPFNIPDLQPGPEVAERNGIFAYCPADHPALGDLIKALNAVDVPSQLYSGGALPERLSSHARSRLTICSEPVDYAEILPTVQLLIHHGGLATAYAGLRAGVPQLILPLSLEHLITAKQTERFGASITLGTRQARDPASIRAAIANLLSDTSMHAAAALAASTALANGPSNGQEIVAAACDAMLS